MSGSPYNLFDDVVVRLVLPTGTTYEPARIVGLNKGMDWQDVEVEFARTKLKSVVSKRQIVLKEIAAEISTLALNKEIL